MPRAWEALIVALTVISFVMVMIQWALPAGSDWSEPLDLADDLTCAVFLADFGARLWRSDDRKALLRQSWLDLVGAIPLVGPLRVVRLARLFRIVRLWRAARGARHLLGRDVEVLGGRVGNVGVVSLVVWVAAAGVFYELERGVNPSLHSFTDALWWAITTLSTVGYGDMYPVTPAGRLVAIVTMVLGVGVLGTLAASLAAGLLELRDWGRRGLGRTNVRDHLLVLGWSSKSPAAVAAFRADPRYERMPVVIAADLESAPVAESEARFVRGQPSKREVLERASAAHAARAVIFARDPSDPRSDHETALVAMTLRKLNPRARMAVELVSSEHHELLEDCGCDAIVDASRVSVRLMVRGVQDVGVSDVVEGLLESEKGPELYRVPVPAALVGRTYRDSAIALVDRRASLIGLARGQVRLLNPDPALVILADDELFVVAQEPF
jgi:voltage-gated potassium channel